MLGGESLTALDLLPGLGDARGDGPDAVVVAGATTSRADLAAAAAALARELAGARMVTLSATSTLDTVVGVLGALLAGVAVVPVAPDAGPLERDHVLRDSGADLVLGDPGWAGVALPSVPIPVPRPGAHPDAAGGALPPAAPMVLYTSGTTGPPKGVVLSAAAIAADLDALAEAWEWTADDVLVHGLPLFHVHGLILGVLGALRTGCRVVHTGRPTPAAYAAVAGGTLYFGVPTVWSRLCQDATAARALKGARLLVSGSAPLTPPVFAALADAHRPPARRAVRHDRDADHRELPRGRRTPAGAGRDAAARGVDPARRRGRHAAARPTATRSASCRSRPRRCATATSANPAASAANWTADGWFRTGDVACIGPDGWHRIVGRASVDLIKCGGYRIGAGEVEAALMAHPAVREAAVVGVPDADLGQTIVAFVVADGIPADELSGFVARGLSVHKRPRRIVFVDELPRNALGQGPEGPPGLLTARITVLTSFGWAPLSGRGGLDKVCLA